MWPFTYFITLFGHISGPPSLPLPVPPAAPPPVEPVHSPQPSTSGSNTRPPRRSVPIPNALHRLALLMGFDDLASLQHNYGGVPFNPADSDLKSCLRFCAQVLHATEELMARQLGQRTAHVLAVPQVELKAAKRAAHKWIEAVCKITHIYKGTVTETLPIPPLLLLLHHGTPASQHLIELQCRYGGVPLPLTDVDMRMCTEFAKLVLEGYAARHDTDPRQADQEWAATGAFLGTLSLQARETVVFELQVTVCAAATGHKAAALPAEPESFVGKGHNVPFEYSAAGTFSVEV